MGEDPTNSLAEATNAAIGAARDLGRFLAQLFSPGLTDLVALKWGDRIAARRLEARINDYERLETLLFNTRARLEQLGVEAVRIPDDNILLPLIEEATLEDDPDLQQLWANLLATAATDDDPLRREYISILADLSSTSASALQDYFSVWQNLEKTSTQNDQITYGPGMDGDNYGYDVARSLVRLGLIEPSWIEFETYEPGGHDYEHGSYAESRSPVRVPGDLTAVAMTGYGEKFSQALGMEVIPGTRMRTSPDLHRFRSSRSWRG